MAVKEYIHVVFDESNQKMQVLPKNDVGEDDLLDNFTKLNLNKPNNYNISNDIDVKQEPHKDFPKQRRISRDLALDNVIRQIEKEVSTKHSLNNFGNTMSFVSQVKPKNTNDALKDEHWIFVMHEELKQYLQ